MNLIEGGRPRIGCIRRQPSAGKLILSLEEGRPSMGKIAGSRRKKGSGGKRTLSKGQRRKQVIRSPRDPSRNGGRNAQRTPCRAGIRVCPNYNNSTVVKFRVESGSLALVKQPHLYS